jgi:hypothetical protein
VCKADNSTASVGKAYSATNVSGAADDVVRNEENELKSGVAIVVCRKILKLLKR